MDQTGCPAGLATDDVFSLTSPAFACNMSVYPYCVLMTFLVGTRVICSTFHTIAWLKRQRNEKNKKALEGRLPIIPLMSWVLTVFQVLVLVLTALNLATAKNGGSFFLYGAAYTIFGVISLFFLLKFVSLGYRISPQARLLNKNMKYPGGELLKKLDRIGNVILMICVLALMGQFVLLCIIVFVYGADDRYVRAGIALEGLFTVSICILQQRHQSRVRRFIDESIKLTNQTFTGNQQDLKGVNRKIGNQQSLMLYGFLMAVPFNVLVAAGVIPLAWYTLTVFMALEVFFSFGLIGNEIFEAYRRKQQQKGSQNTQLQVTSAAQPSQPSGHNNEGIASPLVTPLPPPPDESKESMHLDASKGGDVCEIPVEGEEICSTCVGKVTAY